MKTIPIIDLFAGPGGLGEGFSQSIAGEHPFTIKVSVEKDSAAHQTLALRAFVRRFEREGDHIPAAYYEYLAGDMSRKDLEKKFPREWRAAYGEAICSELGNSGEKHQPLIDRKVKEAVRGYKDWVLIGGPPCQAYSLVGRARMENVKDYEKKQGHVFGDDHRHTLYRQYLRVIAMYSPAVFVMENVKGILSAKLGKERIFPQILKDLRDPSVAAHLYGWSSGGSQKYHIVSFVTGKEPEPGSEYDFLIRAERYGIPQARHRVILLGIRNDVYKKIEGQINPLKCRKRIGLRGVIGNLPELRSGFSKEVDSIDHWRDYFKNLAGAEWVTTLERDVRKEVQKAIAILKKRELPSKYGDSGRFPLHLFEGWFNDDRLWGIPNHSTRKHMAADLARYLFVASYAKSKGGSPHLKDFPKALLPDHKNVDQDDPNQMFSDRFKVQIWGRPASTITSHISKDGHYFIHPDPTQCRSLTVREAARIQTFPDNYFFEGGRTQQYHQVGNAVPPYLAKQLAEVVWDMFTRISTTP